MQSPTMADHRAAPKVSVIIPTRDRSELLRRAVESVRSQSLQDWQVVVVDDGSAQPPSLPMDSRITYVRNVVSRGPSGARNAGLAIAEGEYVVFLDDDDMLAPRALERLYERAAENTMVFGLAGETQSESPAQRRARWNGLLGGEVINDSPTHCQGMYPRATCEWYDESFRTGEDFDWLLRMGEKHYCITIEQVTFLQTVHDSPRAGIEVVTHLEGRLRLLDKHDEWFKRHPTTHSIHLARAGGAALGAKDYRLAKRLAVASLRRKFNLLASKILLRGLTADRWQLPR